jgi:hypothetical protein
MACGCRPATPLHAPTPQGKWGRAEPPREQEGGHAAPPREQAGAAGGGKGLRPRHAGRSRRESREEGGKQTTREERAAGVGGVEELGLGAWTDANLYVVGII